MEAARRIVVWVPDWPIAAAQADGVIPPATPAAIHDGRAIVVTSASARRAGVRRGMRRRTAQQLCPDITLIAVDQSRDTRMFEPVVQAIEDVISDVEVIRPGLVTALARGAVRHFGSEETVAENVIDAVATMSGAECHIGIADGTLPAIVAARAGVIVAAGREATWQFMAAQDIATVTMTAATSQAQRALADLIDLLRRLGIRTVGDFAALSATDVSARFGVLGQVAHRLASGYDVRPPATRRHLEDIAVGEDLDPAVERSDVAAFLARKLAESLADRLVDRGVACSRLEIRARTDGVELVRAWSMEGTPTASDITDRVRWQLEGWLSGRSGEAPSGPLTHLSIIAQETAPAGSLQPGLWGKVSRGHAGAERVATRIQGLLGPEGVLVPVIQGGRDPRSTIRMVSWGDAPAAHRRPDAPWPGAIPEPWPATVPATPWPVTLYDETGTLISVDGRGVLSASPSRVDITTPHEGRHGDLSTTGTLCCNVTNWAGPWPLTERWWENDGGQRRAYIQVHLDHDRIPGLLLATHNQTWRVEGVYD